MTSPSSAIHLEPKRTFQGIPYVAILEPLDITGELLKMGDKVRTTRQHFGRDVTGKVVKMHAPDRGANVVCVEYDEGNGPEAWWSAAFLWRKVTK